MGRNILSVHHTSPGRGCHVIFAPSGQVYTPFTIIMSGERYESVPCKAQDCNGFCGFGTHSLVTIPSPKRF